MKKYAAAKSPAKPGMMIKKSFSGSGGREKGHEKKVNRNIKGKLARKCG
jgi:hypothetical protein